MITTADDFGWKLDIEMMLENSSTDAVSDFGPVAPLGEPLWTVDDVARYLRLGPETVRAMARTGRLTSLKIGRAWRFRRADIEDFIKASLANG